MIKVGVIGLGKMGLLHASILNTFTDVELVAVCEKVPIIRKFAERILSGISVVGDVNELLSLGLDAVYITTPPSSHFPLVKAIYSKGIARNIFVEKPLAYNSAEADESCHLADKSGGINMVGYNKRFGVTFGKAKEILDGGELADVVSFEAHAYSSDFWGAKTASKAAASRGGVLRDLGCHAIDLALWFFGNLEIESAELSSSVNKAAEDHVHINVRTSKGSKGEFEISNCMESYRLPEVGFKVNGLDGVMKVNEDKVELRRGNGKAAVWHKQDLNDVASFCLGEPEPTREDRFFIQSVIDGHDAEPCFNTASRVDHFIDQVRACAEQRTRNDKS
jgi:predicted dehydrogenase